MTPSLKLHQLLTPLAALLFAAASLPAHAGRPLATDDAGTVGDRQCQLEAWHEHGKHDRGWVVSPACGLGDFELGIEASTAHTADAQREQAQTLALKWAPEFASFGPLSLGAKAWTGRSRLSPAAEEDERVRYQMRENGALLLASVNIFEGLDVHANYGLARDRQEHRDARLANLALSYSPIPALQLVVEAQHTQREATTRGAGIRFWAIPEKLGLDLTVSRQAGTPDSRQITLGFGWYGFLGD